MAEKKQEVTLLEIYPGKKQEASLLKISWKARPYLSNAPVSWDLLLVFRDMQKFKPKYDSYEKNPNLDWKTLFSIMLYTLGLSFCLYLFLHCLLGKQNEPQYPNQSSLHFISLFQNIFMPLEAAKLQQTKIGALIGKNRRHCLIL